MSSLKVVPAWNIFNLSWTINTSEISGIMKLNLLTKGHIFEIVHWQKKSFYGHVKDGNNEKNVQKRQQKIFCLCVIVCSAKNLDSWQKDQWPCALAELCWGQTGPWPPPLPWHNFQRTYVVLACMACMRSASPILNGYMHCLTSSS
jgi:hypothetical protein